MNNWEKDVWKTIQHKLKQEQKYEQAYLEAVSSKHDKRRSCRNIIR